MFTSSFLTLESAAPMFSELMPSVYGVLVLVLKFWLPNSGEALGADGDRHSQFPNSAHVMAFYWQLTITHTDSVAPR